MMFAPPRPRVAVVADASLFGARLRAGLDDTSASNLNSSRATKLS